MKKTVYVLVCNHYDLAWRRRAYDVLEDKGRSFVSYADLQRFGIIENIHFCRKYPYYKFNIESVSVLRNFLRENPEYDEELRELIAANRCSTPQTGDNIIDINLVTGESVIRNFVYGRKFLKENFSTVSRICVRNDAFGNSAQLPQIAKQCSCDWIWGLSYTPLSGEYWCGLDGTTLYAGEIANAGTGGSWKKYAPCPVCMGKGCEACQYFGIDRPAAEDPLQIDFHPDVFASAEEGLLTVASEELLPSEKLIRWYEENRERYTIRFVTFNDLQEVVKDKIAHLPSEDELHKSVEHNPNNTGCYVSRIKTKQYVRRLEHRVFRLEYLMSLMRLAGYKVADDALEHVWEKLLTLMAHDIVTAEHVDAVYEDFLQWVEELNREIDRIKNRLMSVLHGSENADAVTVYNPNACVFTDTVDLPSAREGRYTYTDENGNVFSVIASEDGCDRVLVSGLGAGDSLVLYRSLNTEATKCNKKSEINLEERSGNILQTHENDGMNSASRVDALTEKYVIENECIRVSADDCGLLAIYDKKRNTVLSKASIYRPAELIYEHDEGSPWATLSPERSRVPVRTKLSHHHTEDAYSSLSYYFEVDSTASYSIHAIHGEITIRILKDSRRVDFSVQFFCDDINHRLRIMFPTNDDGNGQALYEIPNGTIVREEYTPSYYWAGSNGDWPAIHWGGVSREDVSVAILNRGTPSYCIFNESNTKVIAVSLHRSPAVATYLHEPDSYSMTDWDGMRDAGHHCCELALMGFDGNLFISPVAVEAQAYNTGVLTLNGAVALPTLPKVQSGSVRIAACYPTSNGVALRLLEYSGRKAQIEVKFPAEICEVYRSNILEEAEERLPMEQNSIQFEVKPFEIVTLICRT